MLNTERTRRSDAPGGTPTIEVRVYRCGQFILSQRCETEADTAAAVRGWEGIDGVVCEVDDITRWVPARARHRSRAVVRRNVVRRCGRAIRRLLVLMFGA